MADGSWPIYAGAPGKLKVVGFAGGGGSSVALKLATGSDPDLCANHWLTAVLAHQRHFPRTEHHCADIYDVDARTWRPGERIAFAWFSPDCTDFSKAKGKAPRSERIRGLAWSIIPWAMFRMVDTIMVENVEEIRQWGPVHRTGPMAGEPIADRRGETFERWVRRLEKIGYVVEWRVLNAADYGAPTTRKRLFVIAKYVGFINWVWIKSGLAPSPIVWPAPTHAPRDKAAALGLKPWRGACEVIDWSEPVPSIFLTPAEIKAEGLRIKRPLVAATQRRIARGLEKFVVGAADPFIVPITQRAWGKDRVHDARQPLPTVLASSGGHLAAVDATLAHVIKFQENSTGTDPREPFHTIMAGATRHGVVETQVKAGYLVPRYGEREGQAPRALSIEQPYPVVVPDLNGGALAAVSLQRQFSGSTGAKADEPVGAVMPGGGGKTAMLSAFIGRQFGSTVSGRDVAEPVPTVMGEGAGGKTQVVAAHLGSYYGAGIGSDLADPSRAATGRDRHALTLAHMEQANTGLIGHHAKAPLSTIVGRGTTQRLVAYALEREGGPVGRRGDVLAFLWAHFGEPTEADWADPTGSHLARLRFGLVLLGEAAWMIVDIGLRMLKPSELAAAMGLPADYDLSVDVDGRAVSKTDQIQMIGNMVSPPPAEALIRANCPELIEPDEALAA